MKVVDNIARETLERIGVLQVGHYVLNAGGHAPQYVAKDFVSADPQEIDLLARMLAYELLMLPEGNEIQTVIGPMEGAAVLANRVAYHLGERLGRKVKAAWASKIDDGKELRNQIHRILQQSGVTGEVKFDELLSAVGSLPPPYAFRSTFKEMIRGQSCAIIEDILTTGKNAKLVFELVKETGGLVVGAGALWNRGGVTAATLGVPWLVSLVNETIATYSYPCPQCLDGIPINTDLGKGSDFLREHPAYPEILDR